MSGAESHRKAGRFEDLSRNLEQLGWTNVARSAEPMAFWVPGRIEVLGKHTDYGGGRSLLCAVERGICLLAIARDDRANLPFDLIRIHDAISGDSCELELSTEMGAFPGHWSNYAITVARRIAINFGGALRGADIIFASDLPPAAGVSSSSALVVAIFLALSAVNDLQSRAEYRDNIRTREDLAGYLGCVENGLTFKSLAGHAGVGTFGGSEDQTAILCARAHALVQYSFCPVTFERAIALPAGMGFVIASSGVLAEKTGSALELYNRVSRRLSVGLDYWRGSTGRSDSSMAAAIASSPDALNSIRDVLAHSNDPEYDATSLARRFDQFDLESNSIIPAAADALVRGDLQTLGNLVAQSQLAAEQNLGNQIPETIALVRQARELGAVAASAFGAGFGGSVWALVDHSAVERFRREWSESYAKAFPVAARKSEFFTTLAGPPAARL
jgi:galactokinase